MIQCFVKKEYEAPFGLTQMPRLFSVSRTDEKASAHPRVMHAHDDLVEIVLVPIIFFAYSAAAFLL